MVLNCNKICKISEKRQAMRLDKLDARILAELQKDGRRPVVEIAADIGLSPTPCARRIRQLETAGIVQGYTAIIDPRRLGLAVQAFVQVKLGQHSDETVSRFRRALDQMEEVVSCYATTGTYDFMLQVAVPDLESLGKTVLTKLLKVQGVRDVHSSIALETIKRSVRTSLKHLRNG